ncbi:DNA cytosine methyltransferase [Pararhizobium sp. BT-229]|uniref:DNA cytosine methyltransferase n=1 Tax=Pararhizobium sp. BT-229 TaxID=2986923 RepID=UPI0021F760E1|nr:DNA cytosine methyltransferase [Pararhizobium sp. BT-229]MCV9963689.1 DNA cytosine methyltransferase [Pararhizobium sp. BT-229]
MHSIISFFTGAGFLDLGFEKAGYSIDMVNEYDADFLRGYRHSREHLGSPEPFYGHHLGSVEDFLSDEFRERLEHIVADIRAKGRKVGFVGGPPCPDFSIAGKQAGFEGDNGRLSQVYADLILSIRPDFFVFENVKGLWSTKVHREFYDRMKAEFVEQGGYLLNDRLINALDYGVPQDRERIFLVGTHDAIPEIPFRWEDNMVHHEDMTKLPWPKERTFSPDLVENEPEVEGLPVSLTIEHWFVKNDVLNHPNGDMSFVPKSERFNTVPEGSTKAKSFKRLHRWRPSPTAAYGNNEVHLHPYFPRRLSVAEALAIQSLPAEYQLPTDMTLSKCFKTIGNGVPFLAALGLANTISSFLAEQDERSPLLQAAE